MQTQPRATPTGWKHALRFDAASELENATALIESGQFDFDALDLANSGLKPAAVDQLAAWPSLATFSEVDLSLNRFGAKGHRALMGSEYLAVERLAIVDTKIAKGTFQAMQKGLAGLKLLRSLVMGFGESGSGKTDVAWWSLLGDAPLQQLHELVIDRWAAPAHKVGDHIKALAAMPLLDRLTSLHLVGLELGTNLKAIAKPGLSRLAISSCGAVAGRLAKVDNLLALRHLHLHGARPGDAGVKKLVNAPFAPQLETLDLRNNLGIKGSCFKNWPDDVAPKKLAIGNRELDTAKLASWPQLRNVESLSLRTCGGFARLDPVLSSEALCSVVELQLGANRVDRDKIGPLATSEELPKLEMLGLRGANLRDEMLDELASAPWAQQIRVVDLRANKQLDASAVAAFCEALPSLEYVCVDQAHDRPEDDRVVSRVGGALEMLPPPHSRQ